MISGAKGVGYGRTISWWVGKRRGSRNKTRTINGALSEQPKTSKDLEQGPGSYMCEGVRPKCWAMP